MFNSRCRRLPAARMPLDENAVPPPGLSVFSSNNTRAPFLAATSDAMSPHPPAPMTMMSGSMFCICSNLQPGPQCEPILLWSYIVLELQMQDQSAVDFAHQRVTEPADCRSNPSLIYSPYLVTKRAR